MTDEPTQDEGRRRHYGEFYGLDPVPDEPLLLVHGNCQAESLRILLDAASEGRWHGVRVPPVHEVTAEEVPLLAGLLERTRYLVTQPIAQDYRGLPLGTEQVEAQLPDDAQVCRIPAMWWAATMPTQIIIRADGVGDPPIVPYHDARVLAAAARGERRVRLDPVSADGVRWVHDDSIRQLGQRQEKNGTIDALPMVEDAGAYAMHTINHPTNPVLTGIAQAALDRFGGGEVTNPGRVLLNSVRAPIAASTLDALGLDPEQPAVDGDPYSALPREEWVVDNEPIAEEEVAATQLAWCYEHPQIIKAGVERHRELLAALNL